MAEKVKEKSVSKPKDTILSDSDDSYFECETCNISFTDEKAYRNHLLGKKHNKKIVEEKLKAKSKMSDNDKDNESENEDSDESTELHCETCDKDFTSYISFAAHVKGSTHAKNVKKQKLKKQLGEMPEVIKKENEDNDSEDDGIIPKPYARCSTCSKEFSGPEALKMHMKSAMHLKKAKQEKSLQNFKKENGEHSDGEEIYSKCETCKKSFSGLVPYQIHMQSNVHKKNVDKKKIAEEMKEFCDNTDFDEGYVCKECKKSFTDPLGFKCHLQNNSHEKNKAKMALSEFLQANPEVVYVTPYPYDKDGSGDSDNDELEMYYLICKMCHVSFSGPESAKDHVKSKKHLITKKEKKMQKLLKKQQVATQEEDEPKPVLSNKDQKNGSKNSKEDNLDEFELI